MKILSATLLSLILAATLAGCSGDKPAPAETKAPMPAATGTPAPADATPAPTATP